MSLMLHFPLSGSLRRTRKGGKGKTAHRMGQLFLELTEISYEHVVSGERRDGDPPLLRGGILADVSCLFHAWGVLVLTSSRKWVLGRHCRL